MRSRRDRAFAPESRWCAALVALLVGVLGIGPAAADETLSLSIPLPGSAIALPAILVKPDGDGPFPAIVILHDCSGLGPRSSGSPRRWADLLVANGYVVLLPDSFAPRGFERGVCGAAVPNRKDAGIRVRVGDAFAALTALRAQPFVDAKRIGLLGGSHGGSTTLAVVAEPARGFAAAVALYPGCGFRYGSWVAQRAGGAGTPVTGYAGEYRPSAPLLILAGALDDWSPAEHCRALAATARQSGEPVELTVYPDAHHAFDSPAPIRFVAGRSNVNAPTGMGATTGGNPQAWADAKRRVLAFFASSASTR